MVDIPRVATVVQAGRRLSFTPIAVLANRYLATIPPALAVSALLLIVDAGFDRRARS